MALKRVIMLSLTQKYKTYQKHYLPLKLYDWFIMLTYGSLFFLLNNFFLKFIFKNILTYARPLNGGE
jgi:hypothetical protein